MQRCGKTHQISSKNDEIYPKVGFSTNDILFIVLLLFRLFLNLSCLYIGLVWSLCLFRFTFPTTLCVQIKHIVLDTVMNPPA